MVCSITTTSGAIVGGTGEVYLALVAVISLVGFLSTKVLSAASEEPRFTILSRYLDIAVMPLLIVFALILIVKL
jgi:hypothetical protein